MIQQSVSLTYEPSSDPLHISAQQVFLNPWKGRDFPVHAKEKVPIPLPSSLLRGPHNSNRKTKFKPKTEIRPWNSNRNPRFKPKTETRPFAMSKGPTEALKITVDEAWKKVPDPKPSSFSFSVLLLSLELSDTNIYEP